MAQLGQKAHGFKYLDFLMVLEKTAVVFWGLGDAIPGGDAETLR
jgi:hypothetical protein